MKILVGFFYSLSVFLFNGRNSLPAISRWMQVDAPGVQSDDRPAHNSFSADYAPGVQSDDRPAHNSFSADYCLGCYRSIAIPTPKCCVWAGKSDV